MNQSLHLTFPSTRSHPISRSSPSTYLVMRTVSNSIHPRTFSKRTEPSQTYAASASISHQSHRDNDSSSLMNSRARRTLATSICLHYNAILGKLLFWTNGCLSKVDRRNSTKSALTAGSSSCLNSRMNLFACQTFPTTLSADKTTLVESLFALAPSNFAPSFQS